MIRIADIAYALGSTVDTVQDWCAREQRAAGEADALTRHGARRFHRVQDETQLDLAVRATEALLAQSGVQAAEVDVLVVCHTSPCNALPAPLTLAGEVRRAAGMSRALPFSVGQQQCVSPVHALWTLDTLFQRHPEWQHAVLLCADTVLVERLRPIGDAGIQSDGASAMLVGRRAGSRLLGLHTYNHSRPTEGILADGRYEADPNYLWGLISLVRHVARSAGLRPADFSSVLPHNVNLPAWQQAVDALRIPRERLFVDNFHRLGHTFGSDVAINLADSQALSRPGHHLVVASGIGGTFGGFALSTD